MPPYSYRRECSRALVFSGVAGVQPQVREAPWKTIAHGDVQQELDALPILDLCAMNPRFEHQTLRIYQRMALSSFDLLGPYSIAALFAAHARGLDGLAVHYSRAGLRVPLQAHPYSF